MSPKINKQKVSDKSASISGAKEIAVRAASELVNFSFKYMEERREKFRCFHEDHKYYFEILSRLKSVSSIKVMEIYTSRSNALRAHPIKWSETSEFGFGIPAEDQIVETPYQLSLSANEYGRMHGFFISNTFYIVWFDRNHLLYSNS